MKIQNIDISSIQQKENSRGKHKENDLASLMGSIKKEGLLQPIGVKPKGKHSFLYEVVFGNRRFEACKKLGFDSIPCNVLHLDSKRDFILTNIIENAQRSDVTVYEQGRLYTLLNEEEDMSIPEIAVRVGVTMSNVRSCINAFKDTPKEYRDKVKFKTGGANSRKGDIPISLSERIIQITKRYNLSSSDRQELFKAVSEGFLDIHKLSAIANLVAVGCPLKKAIKNVDRFQYVSVRVPLLKEEIKDYREQWDYPLTNELVDAIFEATSFTRLI